MDLAKTLSSSFKATNVDGKTELDFLTSSMQDFKFVYPKKKYFVRQEEIGRLDLISFKLYNTPSHWWILAQLNGIQDPFEDLEVGSLLIVPDILDINRISKNARQ